MIDSFATPTSPVSYASANSPISNPPKNPPPSFKEESKQNLNLCFWGAIAGMGMFCEAYFILGFGNIKAIWETDPEFESCFEKNYSGTDVCNQGLAHSLSYATYGAMMFGMVSFGYLSDKLGRKWGATTDVCILLMGAAIATGASGATTNGLLTMFLVGLVTVGYAVGAEFPLAATQAAERSEAAHESQPHVRGKNIAFTFAMQGIGNLTSDLVLIALLAGFGCTQRDANDFSDHCDTNDLNVIWRTLFGVGLVPSLGLVIGRCIFQKESSTWTKDKEVKIHHVVTRPGETLEAFEEKETQVKHGLLLKHYWSRLVGTAIGWLIWDFAYYGTKGYNSTIIQGVVSNDPTLTPSLWLTMQYTLYGQLVQCVGYYLAAFVVDKPWMGRRNLQGLGYFAIMICQFISYAGDLSLNSALALYFISGFFQQFGPNVTTWMLPAELFPTEVRSFAHGISSATGKFGAILSGVIFAYGNGGQAVTAKTISLLSGILGVVGIFITFFFIPNITRLDLTEQDRRWKFILAGREDEYSGEAINPEYLSWYERVVMNIHKNHKSFGCYM